MYHSNLPYWIALAFLLESVIIWPNCLPHPVVFVGRLIALMERTWNRPEFNVRTRRILGLLSVGILVLISASAGVVLTGLAQRLTAPFSGLTIAILGIFGLAAGSLWQHIQAIQRALSAYNLEEARQALSMIVGRDTDNMTSSEVANAAIESLAESFNDGVVAPLFWFIIAGLPGLFAYKSINTADSMIGHMEPRWRAFGWAAARLDDVMNLIPARIAGALLATSGLISFRTVLGWKIMFRDAPKHPSPNAGWPEAAMAGGLNIQLGGPVSYDGQISHRAQLGQGRQPMTSDLSRAKKIYLMACFGLLIFLVFLGIIWPQ